MGRCLKKSVKFSGVIERFVRCLDFWWVEGMDWHLSGRMLGLVEKLRRICAELENAHED